MALSSRRRAFAYGGSRGSRSTPPPIAHLSNTLRDWHHDNRRKWCLPDRCGPNRLCTAAFVRHPIGTHEPSTPSTQAIRASARPSEHDFDFLVGHWQVHNRKLKARLQGSNEWSEFLSALHMRKVLNGYGNVENHYADFDGQPFEGMAIRLLDPASRLWTIHWIDSNTRAMDGHPVSGSFEDAVGRFSARNTFNGMAIVVLYQWDARDPDLPIWSQAFSDDDGATWEWNR